MERAGRGRLAWIAVAYGVGVGLLLWANRRLGVGDHAVKVGLDVAHVEMMRQMIPLGRPGTPDETADAVHLFCLPESDYVTGEVLVAAGGLRM